MNALNIWITAMANCVTIWCDSCNKIRFVINEYWVLELFNMNQASLLLIIPIAFYYFSFNQWFVIQIQILNILRQNYCTIRFIRMNSFDFFQLIYRLQTTSKFIMYLVCAYVKSIDTRRQYSCAQLIKLFTIKPWPPAQQERYPLFMARNIHNIN